MVADPVKLSQLMPIIGSSEKVMAIAAFGLTKYARIWVISVSPSTVVDMALLALGASITTRIQISLPRAAARRVAVATTASWPWAPPCGPLATTVLISVAAVLSLRAGRTERGTGAAATTMLARSTGEEAA